MSDMDWGRAMQRHRKALGISQRELAEKLEVSLTTVSRWESGRRFADDTRLCAIARALGLPDADYLLNGTPTIQPPAPPECDRACNRCRQVKPIDQFEPAKRYRNGRMPVCRACRTQYRADLASRPKVDPEPVKSCRRCEIEQPIAEFGRRKAAPDGRTPLCRTCRSAVRFAAADSRTNWARWLRWKFNITPADYERMLAAQGGVCAICGEPPKQQRARLDIDHDHETGEIRGLLCSPCNRSIGMLMDRPIVALKAARYLLGDNAVTWRGEYPLRRLTDTDMAEMYEYMLDSAVYARRLIYESEVRAKAKQAIDAARDLGYVPKRDIPGVTS